ncbi:MAG TPA: hypothetical protein VES38_07195 [Methylotenera sp.]|nr:hypothetical protein [Methylotenera sp.]
MSDTLAKTEEPLPDWTVRLYAELATVSNLATALTALCQMLSWTFGWTLFTVFEAIREFSINFNGSLNIQKQQSRNHGYKKLKTPPNRHT